MSLMPSSNFFSWIWLSREYVESQLCEVGGHVFRVETPHRLEHFVRVFRLEAGHEGVDLEQQTA